MTDDVFGDIIDAGTVEDWFKATLQQRLPGHLAHQERRRNAQRIVAGLDPLADGSLIQPKSWPTVSEFDLQPQDQLPAIVIASPGTTGQPVHDRGKVTKVWRMEVAVAVGDRTETGARRLAALYLAAIEGAIVQNQTLGGKVDNCRLVGPDDHLFGEIQGGGQRAIYGTAFEITVRSFADARLGTTQPPDDPFHPEPFPDGPTEAVIDVTYLEETP